MTVAKLGKVSPTSEWAGFIGRTKRCMRMTFFTSPAKANGDLCGVGLLKHDARIRDVMLSQDCLYTVVERGARGEHARVIGSIVNFLFGPGNTQEVIEKMASPDRRIVSLTITEGGYYVHQGTGEFDAQHPDIQHDLAHPSEPTCSFGYLLEALNQRRTRGIPPFTVMSCDNLQSNGDIIEEDASRLRGVA